MNPYLRGVLSLLVLIGIAFALSSNRKRFPWKIVGGGLFLQIALAVFVLKSKIGEQFFEAIALMVTKVLDGANAGAKFVLEPFVPGQPAWYINLGVVIMSSIIFISTLTAIGYHYHILQRVVYALAWVMQRTMGVTGREALSGSANVFLGQTEAPLLIRPYIPGMTQSELMAMMTGGFATAAAGVLAVYVNILGGDDPANRVAITRHLLTACLMSAPGAFVMAKIMIPPAEDIEDENIDETSEDVQMTKAENLLDAISDGASQGMKLAINVIAMLIAFVALITLTEIILGAIGRLGFMQTPLDWLGLKELSISSIFSLVFDPIARLIGISGEEVKPIAAILGKGISINEIIAFQELAAIRQEGVISERSMVLATYALCGFANLASIGIQIGGISPMAPNRRGEIARLAPRAMLGGAMARWMTATIASMLIVAA